MQANRANPRAGHQHDCDQTAHMCRLPHTHLMGCPPDAYAHRRRPSVPCIRLLVPHSGKLLPGRPLKARRMGLSRGRTSLLTLGRTDGPVTGPAQGRICAPCPVSRLRLTKPTRTRSADPGGYNIQSLQPIIQPISLLDTLLSYNTR